MGGAYVNFMMEEGQERVRATYRDNYGRLAAIKVKYDPANLFHVNQNISPASAGVEGGRTKPRPCAPASPTPSSTSTSRAPSWSSPALR
jgi:Berberine and berberine like